MKTKTINLYEYSELSPEAQKKALDQWNETNDNPFMQWLMINELKVELDQRGIAYDEDSIDVWYSLSYCQGDGFMFVGTLYPFGNRVIIKHNNGRYYDYNTALFNYDTDEAQASLTDFSETMTEAEQKAFEEEYRAICKKMEQIGYDEIEYQQSEECFLSACEVNGFTFRANGEMES